MTFVLSANSKKIDLHDKPEQSEDRKAEIKRLHPVFNSVFLFKLHQVRKEGIDLVVKLHVCPVPRNPF